MSGIIQGLKQQRQSQYCMMKQPAVMHKALAVAMLLAAASVIYWKATIRQGPGNGFVDEPSFRVQSSTFASVMPAQLQGVPFNVSLGCWHIRADPRGPQAFHVVAEANFEPGERWEEVLYGTPVHIGNLYPGPKFAISIDNWLPPVTWKCTFSTGNNQPVVYVVQRTDRAEFSGKGNRTCLTNMQTWQSADGILYDYIPTDVVDWLRFPRTYWGCESVVLFVLKRAGIKLVNLCPFYSPIHAHKEQTRDPHRLRVNHQLNSLTAGESLDMQPFCQHTNDTSL